MAKPNFQFLKRQKELEKKKKNEEKKQRKMEKKTLEGGDDDGLEGELESLELTDGDQA